MGVSASKRPNQKDGLSPWRHRLHEIIFESETRAGKFFDIVLFAAIVASVIAVILESVSGIERQYGPILRAAEWGFTVLFTIEYILRLISVMRPIRYAASFFGIVDLISILPTYLSLLIPGAQSMLVIRGFRLLRIFRVLKLMRLSVEAETLLAAVRASRPKIIVFVGTMITLALIMGTLMYLVEGNSSGIPNIPTGIYWAVMTMTTVGYGDIVPHTAWGKFITSIVMVMGYGLIAVPTGIVSVELAHAAKLSISTNTCPGCNKVGHDLDASYCRFCGMRL